MAYGQDFNFRGYRPEGYGQSSFLQNAYDKVKSIPIFGSDTAGKFGQNIHTNGLMDYAGNITNAIGGFMNIGAARDRNKIAKDQLDLSKKEFWTNMAMNRDAYNRKINKNSAYSAFFNAVNNGGPIDRNGIEAKYSNKGDAIVRNDGSEYNVIDIPSEHMGQGYVQNPAMNQVTPANPQVAGNSAFAGAALPGISSVAKRPGNVGTSAFAKAAQPVKNGPAKAPDKKKLG